jgi:hypothetical protein
MALTEAKRLAKEYERMKVLRGLANDLRPPNAATDCAAPREEFARATRKSVDPKAVAGAARKHEQKPYLSATARPALVH